ncbi:GrpB family protein [Paractinoplanes hotanensis]|uniref:GrpB family protein n=1 Tax=Paractinoplanes hotanensis TaxID=2906497 RepID=A0ABT0XYR2_9ACTN|nr:GrpB family protein [Actinoplanes hotanensis]MCM4078928.1 GrpB family protein [Actinoplanes hotanensis]
MRQDPIKILPYDVSWPDAFEQQRARVEPALLPWLTGPVEHIGSTAVPGLAAKPIIDMLARIDSYDAGGIEQTLAALGWVHAPEPGDAEKRKWSFCYPDEARRTHHLHIYENSADVWPRLLAFRDHLRTHQADAAAYAELKQSLAAEDSHDRPRYRAGKAPFIESLS